MADIKANGEYDNGRITIKASLNDAKVKLSFLTDDGTPEGEPGDADTLLSALPQVAETVMAALAKKAEADGE